MGALPPITVYRFKTELGRSLGVGSKFVAKRPFIAELRDTKGRKVGYVNVLDLLRQC